MSAVYTKQKHVEHFEAGRKGRNGIIQIPDCTEEEAELRKATRGTSTAAVGRQLGCKDPNSYNVQESRLGTRMLQMTSHRARVSTQGYAYSQHSFPLKPQSLVVQGIQGLVGEGKRGDKKMKRDLGPTLSLGQSFYWRPATGLLGKSGALRSWNCLRTWKELPTVISSRALDRGSSSLSPSTRGGWPWLRVLGSRAS